MPKPAPYRYELIAEGNITAFPDLALRAPAKLAIRKFAVRHSDSGADLAELHVADLGEGAAPVLLDWQNATGAVPLALPAGRRTSICLQRQSPSTCRTMRCFLPGGTPAASSQPSRASRFSTTKICPDP